MPRTITDLLEEWNAGDDEALGKALEEALHELNKVARSQLSRERSSLTLQTGDLVNEVYIRLVKKRQSWPHRKQFYAYAAKLMRQILVDHARKVQTIRRGKDHQHVELEEVHESGPPKPLTPEELIDLDRALTGLKDKDPRMCRIIELRYFTGRSIEETAEIMEISVSTVKREWGVAKLWLSKELKAAKQSRLGTEDKKNLAK